jgi:aspartate 1-decarboxylase
MQRTLLKSKIHRATVTEANLEYEGSISIDADLVRAAELLEYEQVQIYNITNGQRLTTYVILGEPGSGTICLNGAAAHCADPGDLIIICSYAAMSPAEVAVHRPRIILVDQQNRVSRVGPLVASQAEQPAC